MRKSNTKLMLKTPLAVAVLAAALLATGSADAKRGGDLVGSWSGGGTLTMPSGATERARCRATFYHAGPSFGMDAVCATASTRVSQTANLRQVGPTRFAGYFHNPEYNVSGSIQISLHGDSLNAALEGGGGAGHFHLSR